MKRTTYAVLVVALLVVSTLLLVPGQALADVPTKASPTWQPNGIVYAIAYARGNVYIGGAFTSVRPPGAAPGTGEVARNHLAAFNATTGALLSFNHNATPRSTAWSRRRTRPGCTPAATSPPSTAPPAATWQPSTWPAARSAAPGSRA